MGGCAAIVPAWAACQFVRTPRALSSPVPQHLCRCTRRSYSRQRARPIRTYCPFWTIDARVLDLHDQVELGVADTLIHAGLPNCPDAPVSVRYVSTGHETHSDDPGVSLYLPEAHGKHGPPSSPVNPALQIQPSTEALPGLECVWLNGHGVHVVSDRAPSEAEYVPAGHSAQSSSPIWSLNVPAAQATHSLQPPVYPAMQWQCAKDALPGSAVDLTGHTWHVCPEIDATTVENVPFGQSTQLPAPLPSLNDPAGHSVH
eukprot:3938625-Rhodomonas_salina.1